MVGARGATLNSPNPMSLPRMDAPADAATREPRFPKWAAALADQTAFDQEQARLGEAFTRARDAYETLAGVFARVH